MQRAGVGGRRRSLSSTIDWAGELDDESMWWTSTKERQWHAFEDVEHDKYLHV